MPARCSLSQRLLGGAEIGDVAVRLCQMQRHAVDEAAHQRAPAGPQQFRPDIEVCAPASSARRSRENRCRARASDHHGTSSSRRSTARPRRSRRESGRARRSKTRRASAGRLRASAPTERRRRLSARLMMLTPLPATRRWSAIQRSRSASARALIACFLATVFSLPRSRDPSGFLVGGAASGGNRPKLMFIGWNERGPASMVSMWPPVMWPSSEPSAVVAGGGASDCPRASAAA